MVRRTIGHAGLLTAALAGCQAAGGTPITLTQTPPTIRAAYLTDHAGTTVQGITRRSAGGQELYTVHYLDPDGSKHDLVYNGAGDEIDEH